MPGLTANHAPKGLEGVVATNSKICYIDGDQGVLAYRGIDIHELADHSNFEETCYLLWFGKLATRSELRDLHDRLAEERKLDASIISLLRNAPVTPCRWMCCALRFRRFRFTIPQEKSNDSEANVDKAIRLTSQIAMIVAAYDRIRKGKPVVEPDRSLSHAANFLLMLNGKHPSATAERALDIALILHADHELNASTFAARVTAATLSDMHSAITSAIGALKGPLHGGANEAVFRILKPSILPGPIRLTTLKACWRRRRKFLASGIACITPKTREPRICASCRAIWGTPAGKPKWFDISHKIEEFVKADKKLNANVDFYSASTYHTLGIDVDLFTPMFAVSRISGWTAHVIEQLDDNRLIRPRADYIGPGISESIRPY